MADKPFCSTGELRHKIRIQKLSGAAQDAVGNQPEIWVDVAPSGTWAKIEPLMAGKEIVIGEQLTALATHKITMRYRPGLDTKMRLVFGTRNFHITNINNWLERNVWLVLFCTER